MERNKRKLWKKTNHFVLCWCWDQFQIYRNNSCNWIKIDQFDVTCFIISLFNAQHVSDINTSILMSLRLICWVISWVVLLWFDVCWCYVVVRLGWCGIRMQAEACIQVCWKLASRIRTYVLILYEIYRCCVYSEKLLMMDRGTVRNM